MGIVGLEVDLVLAAISRFLAGTVQRPAPERRLAVVMFTDLIGSTSRAASAGDSTWKVLLDQHDATSRTEIANRGVRVVRTTGDGVRALMPSATTAIKAAQATRTDLGGTWELHAVE